MDIVMITRDRPDLTEQTIRSMRENAADWSKHRLVVVFDGSEEECHSSSVCGILHQFTGAGSGVFPTTAGKQLGVGGAKNYGADVLSRWRARDVVRDRFESVGELLMFSDSDMYYLPRWDTLLEAGMSWFEARKPVQLGGWRHPFHGLNSLLVADWRPLKQNSKEYALHAVDAVTGNCFVMRWSDWLRYGPFDANAIGPGQSEDFALSQRVRAGGGLVATLDPPVAIHCGLTNSIGEPATGWREMAEMARQQLRAMPESERVKVQLLVPSEAAPDAAVVDEQYRKREQLAEKLNTAAVEMGFMRPAGDARPLGVNCGSGQRRFETTREIRWMNVDRQNVPPDRVPDVVCDVGHEQLPLVDGSARYVVLHQVLEHFGCGEATAMLRECWRVLAPGGSLIITVPDMRALAGRWLGGELDTQVYMTAVYGAYMGDEADRHRWGFTAESLRWYLADLFVGFNDRCDLHADQATIQGVAECDLCTEHIKPFDWRAIPGADIARDFWILGMEIVKP